MRHLQESQPKQAVQFLPSQRRQRARPVLRRILGGLVFGLIGIFALFPLIVGLLFWLAAKRASDSREVWRWIGAGAISGSVIYVIWLWQASLLPLFWQSLSTDLSQHLWQVSSLLLVHVWLFNLLLAPTCAFLPAAFNAYRSRSASRASLKELSVAEYESAVRNEQIMEVQEEEAFQTLISGAPVTNTPSLSPLASSAQERLGSYEGGELAEWVDAGQFCLPPELLRLHGVLIGEPSYGKTTTLIRLLAIARRYGRKVIYLDLKGSHETAARFLAAMKVLGVKSIKMYPREAYDGWRGDSQALFNRLMEQIDAQRTHPFYRAGVGATVVSLALNAPGSLPRTSSAFLERLDLRWLRRAYTGNAQALREIRDVEEHISGLALVFAGFFRSIAGGLDGSWAFEDAEACYVGIDGTAHKEEAAALGRYLLEEAAHYATVRKSASDQATLIIDEFGVLRSTNATDLFERIREAGMSIYAAAQSYSGLGMERDHVLAASAIKMLHRTGAPEPVIKYAGQRERPQFSRSIGGAGSAEEELLPAMNRPAVPGERPDTFLRPQKEYTILIEEIQQLAPGHAVLIHGGQGAFVQIAPLAIPDSMLQAARRFLATSPRFAQAPAPQTPPGIPASAGPAKPRRSPGRQRSPQAQPSPQSPIMPKPAGVSQARSNKATLPPPKASKQSGQSGPIDYFH